MQRKKNPPAFIVKTYYMLERTDLAHIVSWSEDGRGFIIHNIVKFQAIVLPQYFKHKKFTSFVRQLNMYGFHKQRNQMISDYYFQHETFKKGENLTQVKRKPQKKKKSEEISKSVRRIQKGQNTQQKIDIFSQNIISIEKIDNPKICCLIDQQNQKQDSIEEQVQSSHQVVIYSINQIAEQAISQNQIISKTHPILLSSALQLKKIRLTHLENKISSENETNGSSSMQILKSLCNILKSETTKLNSLLENQSLV